MSSPEVIELRDVNERLEVHFPDPRSQDEGSSRTPTLRDSTWKRRLVVVGAVISQLPVWGFAMNYGVFQEYYTSKWTFAGDQELTGIIGTTSNGVMYLSMPLFFTIFTHHWSRYRQLAGVVGILLSCLSFLLSSFSSHVWHLVVTQGVMSALGCALVYSTITLSLGEWYNDRNRALVYGICLSAKSIIGTVCPFLWKHLLDQYGFPTTLRIWTGVTAGAGTLAVYLVPTDPSRYSSGTHGARRIPWHFIKHRTFWIYMVAIVFQSSGYGIPQTYLNTYAHDVSLLSEATATLLLTLFNIPTIVGASFIGYLTENKRFSLAPMTISAISSITSALSVFILWGLAAQGGIVLLILFSISFGFFAGGYSAIWGGFLNDMETEAIQRNEAIDTAMIYGLLNGARGVGYVAGGLAGVPLLKAGSGLSGDFAYGTSYGALIIFTGLSSLVGGWGILF